MEKFIFFFTLAGRILSFVTAAIMVSSYSPEVRAVSPVSLAKAPLFAQEASSGYPIAIRRLLARHEVWQTVVVSTIQLPSFVNPLVQTKISKKWRVTLGSGGAIELREITNLSLDPDPKSGAIVWSSSEVDLLQPIFAQPFYFEAAFQKNPTYQFRDLEEDRFELRVKSDSGVEQIVFLPSSFKTPKPWLGISRPVNVWTAPLGAGKRAFEDVMRLSKPDSAYLHHDLSRTKQVILDESFPETYRDAVKRILLKWNRALGAELFRLAPGRVRVDAADCLSDDKLCFDWVGPQILPWTGMGASAVSSFDPQSGEILGGLITFSNSARADHLKESDIANDADDDIVRSGVFDLFWIAKTYLRRFEFLERVSPIPEKIVESLLLHEVGHFNGFAHNFAGSVDGSMNAPSKTIMDYIPFPAVGHFMDLGDFDRQMISLVYEGKAPSLAYRFGGDFESISEDPHRKANVNTFDLGDPAEWYILLALNSEAGVFAEEPSSAGADILSYLIDFLDDSKGASPGQIRRVNSFLCAVGERKKIENRALARGRKLYCD